MVINTLLLGRHQENLAIVKKLILLLTLLLLSFLPFSVMQDRIFPTQTGKTFAFLLFMLVMVGVRATQCLFIKESTRLKVSYTDSLLLILLIYFMVNRYWIQDTFGFSFRLYELLGLAVCYFLLRSTNPQYYTWLLLAGIFGGLLQAVYGNLQLHGFYASHHPGFPLTGSFFNPGPYAGYLSTVFPAALGFYLFADQRFGLAKPWQYSIAKTLCLITVLGILLVLQAAQSRAAWLALTLSSAMLSFFRYRWDRKLSQLLNGGPKKIAFRLLAGSILFAGIAGLYVFKKDSADGRLLIWKAAWGIVKENPFVGVGFDRYKATYMNAQAKYFIQNPSESAIHLADDSIYAFNEAIQLLVEGGIIGFALVMILLVFLFRIQGSKAAPEVRITQTGIVSILIFGMFSYPSQILPIKLCGILYLAILSASATPLNRGMLKKILISRKPSRFLVLCILLVLSWAGFHLHKLYMATGTWKNALSLYQRGSYQSSLQKYREVYPIFAKEGDFLTNYGKALSVAEEHARAVEVLESARSYLANTIIQTALGDSYLALGRYGEAEAAYMLAGNMLPDRFYPKYLLARLYQITGERDKLLPIARYLVEKKPKVPSPAVEEIKKDMRKLLE